MLNGWCLCACSLGLFGVVNVVGLVCCFYCVCVCTLLVLLFPYVVLFSLLFVFDGLLLF